MDMKKIPGIVAALTAAILLGLGGAAEASPAQAGFPDQVGIRGDAYVFGFRNTPITGATVRVREFPRISARTGPLGGYFLRVPNDSDVTPYIESGKKLLIRFPDDPSGSPESVLVRWHETDLQTFHTRSQEIRKADIQAPARNRFIHLAVQLGLRHDRCVIFGGTSEIGPGPSWQPSDWKGLADASARSFPSLGGPVYLNEFGIPDDSLTETTGDGGFLWPNVASGQYRVVTTGPAPLKVASFLARCRPGRIINAGAPWGPYQRIFHSGPAGANRANVTVDGVGLARAGRRQFVRARVHSLESLHMRASVRLKGDQLAIEKEIGPGITPLRLWLPRGARLKVTPERYANVYFAFEDKSGTWASKWFRILP